MRTTPIRAGRTRRRTFLLLVLIVLMIPVAVMAAGGTFTDDDSSLFEKDIEWLAVHGVTRGCNPPANDRFCPDDNVTRGQMAAFLRRFSDDQANNAYIAVADASMEIVGQETGETVLELTGLPEGSYYVTAKGEFTNSELHAMASPTCVLMAGFEFDTAAPTVDPGRTVAWSLTALTYLAEDNSVVNLDCMDHGLMITLDHTRVTAVGVNGIDIQSSVP